jgi:hypothetical protein
MNPKRDQVGLDRKPLVGRLDVVRSTDPGDLLCEGVMITYVLDDGVRTDEIERSVCEWEATTIRHDHTRRARFLEGIDVEQDQFWRHGRVAPVQLGATNVEDRRGRCHATPSDHLADAPGPKPILKYAVHRMYIHHDSSNVLVFDLTISQSHRL